MSIAAPETTSDTAEMQNRTQTEGKSRSASGTTMGGLPETADEPPFRITRASHFTLRVRDLEASRRFYCDVVGLVVSDADADTLYLRGVEESAHHSLTLKRAASPSCERVGLRVQTEADLERAAAWFSDRGLPAAYVSRPYQGATLHVADPAGIPLELCASMDQQPRRLADLAQHRGGAALRLDHYQISVPDTATDVAFYAELGFRVSDYIQDDATGDLIATFLHRKSNPHDLVLTRRGGPLFHHVGYIVAELSHIFQACDSAGALGMGEAVERGPGRHGLAHALFVYLRDPDGHRIELLLPPIQSGDTDVAPTRWSASNGFAAIAWGLPAQRSWFEEATLFEGVPVTRPPTIRTPATLEDYLARRTPTAAAS